MHKPRVSLWRCRRMVRVRAAAANRTRQRAGRRQGFGFRKASRTVAVTRCEKSHCEPKAFAKVIVLLPEIIRGPLR